MAILGSIIKKGIEWSAALQSNSALKQDQQVEELRKLLDRAASTSFGLYHGFTQLLENPDPRDQFAQQVPIFNYQELENRWWRKQQRYPDITWPGKPQFFALSSGTTGKKSKRIPITKELLIHMRSVGTDLVRDLSSFDLPEEVFEKEVFVLSSSADLKENDLGFVEGEVSGINVHNFPGWYDFFYRPGKEIAEIDSWDERLNRIVAEAPNWDIGAIAGIPSWILMMLKTIVESHKLDTIHDLWPHLAVYSTGGVAFEPYRANFEKLCASPLCIIDTYLASEGFFGYRSRPETMSMKLAMQHNIYYEFIPFDSRGFDSQGNLLEGPEVHKWEDLEENMEYALLISTCAGAWRYMIGDTIKFTDLDRAEFVITGRTKFFLNVVGSQLSEEKINAAVKELSDQIGVAIDEFAVAALQGHNMEYYHQWMLASDDPIDAESARKGLDGILKEMNKNYRVARSKSLKDIRVLVLPKDQYYDWLETIKKKGGQVKTPKVMPAERMEDLLDFVSNK